MTVVDISAVLSWQKTFPFMSQTSQNQQAEPSSWPVWADFLISHYMSFQVVLSVIHQTHPSSLQTGKICPWMTRPPTKCCGFQKAAPRFVEELRRFVPSWTGRRDTSTLHRCVTHTHMHLDDVYWRKHITLFLFRSLKGVVQRGNLEHEGLLGGGVLRLGGNWSHVWRSREEGECRAQWPRRKRGVLGSLLVRNAVRDLVQWYQERHKQRPFLLCDWSLPWPACRDYQLLCRDGGGSRATRSTVVQSGDINGSKDSPWFLDWDSVFLHHPQETWMKCLKSYTFNCLITIYLEITVIKWFTAVLLSLFWNMFFEK